MKSQDELKKEYKMREPQAGVYQIRNVANGKIFIGGSASLDTIWNRHRVTLNFGNHHNRELQNEWKEFGETGFVYEILYKIKPVDDPSFDYSSEVRLLEKMHIEELQPYGEKGYHRPMQS